MVRSAPAPRVAHDPKVRARAIRRTTLTAIVCNAGLAIGQIVTGVLANAFSLVADAVHTLSDLVTDFLVLLAGQHGATPADEDHPYGHGRIETAVTLLLGAVLTAVGLGFLWASGTRLQNMENLPPLHSAALYMALATLVVKEGLFRYTLSRGRKWNAPLLEANAWHARSDAASSLVVAAGIGGSLAGYPFLEPLAAAVVGFLIASMGLRIGWRALRELIDTGLPPDKVDKLRATVLACPGVLDLHNLRTRRMADRVLCDVHLLVEPRISVSEGHRISDVVYRHVRRHHPEVSEVLVHIDAEDDTVLEYAPAGEVPERDAVAATVVELLGNPAPTPLRTQLHYLGGRVEVEVMMSAHGWANVDQAALQTRIAHLLEQEPVYRSITFFVQSAPT